MSVSCVRARRHRAVPADRPAGAPMRPSRRCGCWPTSTRRILFRDFILGSPGPDGANDRAQGWRAVSGAGEVANVLRSTAALRFAGACSADSVGAGLVGAAAGEVGGERRELRGHRQIAGKFSSTVTATLASLAQRYGSESSAEFPRVHQLCLSHACARGAIERCQPTDPPVRLTRSSRRRGCWPTSTAGFFFADFFLGSPGPDRGQR